MPISNEGSAQGPVAFQDVESFDQMLAAVRYVKQLMKAPSQPQQPVPLHSISNDNTISSFKVTGAKDSDGFYPAVEQFRNVESSNPSIDWWGSAVVYIQGINKEPLTVGGRFAGVFTDFLHAGQATAIVWQTPWILVKCTSNTVTDSMQPGVILIKNHSGAYSEGEVVRMILCPNGGDKFRNNGVYELELNGTVTIGPDTFLRYSGKGSVAWVFPVCRVVDEVSTNQWDRAWIYAPLEIQEDVPEDIEPDEEP